MEKNIAYEIVSNEINVENEVTKKLAIILDNHIGRIQKQKRIVTKLMQDKESAKHKYEVNEIERKPLTVQFNGRSLEYFYLHKLKPKYKQSNQFELNNKQPINNTHSHCTRLEL